MTLRTGNLGPLAEGEAECWTTHRDEPAYWHRARSDDPARLFLAGWALAADPRVAAVRVMLWDGSAALAIPLRLFPNDPLESTTTLSVFPPPDAREIGRG